jgi:hypothetical protein
MRIAESVPAFCSACYGQEPDAIYVDFESAWDGPIIDDANGMKISIDDLVICERCLLAAANLKGLDATKDLREENLELGVLVEKLEEKIKEKDMMINDLSHTVSTLIKNPVERKKGRPKTIVPETA